MFKLFFKNLKRSLLTSFVALVPAFLLSLLVKVVCEETALHLSIPPLALAITNGVITALVTVVWFIVALTFDWFYTGEYDTCEHPPFFIFGYLRLFLAFALYGGISVLILVFGFGKIQTAVASNDNYNFLLVTLPSLAVSSFLYFFVMAIHYGSWQICWHCGRMFCIDYTCTGKQSWDSTEYKTYTRKENIGSISADDRKIADITGNVTYGYLETAHHTRKEFKGYCCRCGHGKYQITSSITYD